MNAPIDAIDGIIFSRSVSRDIRSMIPQKYAGLACALFELAEANMPDFGRDYS